MAAGLIIASAIIWPLAVMRLPRVPTAPVTLPWWGLALLFFASERWPVVLPLRSSRPRVVLCEIPLIIGLFFSSPDSIVLGYAAGFGAATLLRRGWEIRRVAMNFGQQSFFLGVAALVFHWLGNPGPLLLQGWLAAYAAAGALNLTAITTLLALWSRTGSIGRSTLIEAVAFSFFTAVVNGSLGLLGAVLLWHDPPELALAIFPALALCVMYASYTGERRKREAVEFLHGADDAMHREPELEAAILSMLSGARRAFRAQFAQLTIYPTQLGEMGYRTTVAEGGPTEVLAAVPMTDLDDLDLVGDAMVVETGSEVGKESDLLRRHEVHDALAAVLRGSDRQLGALVIGGHTAAYVYRFDDRDLHLFRTLAVQTAAALENGHLEQAVTTLSDLQVRLQHQANHDALTGLTNRAAFSESVSEAIQRRGGGQIAILFVDLDDFKSINETLGYATGDDVLVAVAQRLEICLRKPDMAARWDGDEFAVLLEDVNEVAEAEAVAARIHTALKPPLQIGLDTLRVRASIGVAVRDSNDIDAAELLRHADVAVHAAKATGKECSVRYLAGMDSAVVTRHQLRGELETAIDENQLLVYYQPVVDLETGAITGSEALIRWQHPHRGIVGPGEFIPLAEESGLIIAIGSLVLREACRQATIWQQKFNRPAPLSVSVNVSGRQLQQPRFVEEVLDVVKDIGMDPRGLVIELTETILLEDSAAVLSALEGLRRGGIRIALDDFGTGYSSLGYLRRLPIDILKIAKPFVDDLSSEESSGDFARAVVGIGNALKMTLVAEGIEEAAQADHLRRLGCRLGQGFLMARPMPPAQVEQLLEKGGVDPGILGLEESADQIIPLRRPSSPH